MNGKRGTKKNVYNMQENLEKRRNFKDWENNLNLPIFRRSNPVWEFQSDLSPVSFKDYTKIIEKRLYEKVIILEIPQEVACK